MELATLAVPPARAEIASRQVEGASVGVRRGRGSRE